MIKYFYIAVFFSFFFSCKPLPEVEAPEELKQLERVIQKETNSIQNNFSSIPEYEIENCNANIYIYIYIKNDTINSSEKSLNDYIKSVSNRVNMALMFRECYKTLTIETSSSNHKNLKDRIHRFEFPIE